MSNNGFPRRVSAGSNWRNMPVDHSFNNRWRYISKKELSANMYCNGKVRFISVFRIGFLNDYG